MLSIPKNKAVAVHVPLYAAPGKNSIEQLFKRAHMEALNTGATYINLRHFAGALIGHPNGPVRFQLQQAMREEDISEPRIREILELGPFEPIDDVAVLRANPRFHSPALNLVMAKADEIPTDSKLNALLLALLDLVPGTQGFSNTTPGRKLILSVKKGDFNAIEKN